MTDSALNDVCHLVGKMHTQNDKRKENWEDAESVVWKQPSSGSLQELGITYITFVSSNNVSQEQPLGVTLLGLWAEEPIRSFPVATLFYSLLSTSLSLSLISSS